MNGAWLSAAMFAFEVDRRDPVDTKLNVHGMAAARLQYNISLLKLSITVEQIGSK